MRAPISGTVVKNKAVRGAAVNPGDVLYHAGHTRRGLDHRRHLRRSSLRACTLGQQLEAVTTAFPGEVFKGTIARISPDIDPDTHTLQIRCEVNNPGGRLKPQMLAQRQDHHAAGRRAGGAAGRAGFRHRRLLRVRRSRRRAVRAARGRDRVMARERLRARAVGAQAGRASGRLTNRSSSTRSGIRRTARARRKRR